MVKDPQHWMGLESRYGAHNYRPLPVVIERGAGVHVWDVTGKQYFDFLSAYSALNQGHNHPRIVGAAIEQIQRLSLTSRAFYNDQLGEAEAFLARLFGYDKVLLMNSGAEAVESAIKMARKWGYEKKGVAENEAVIVVARENFHGRTTTVISFSTDPVARKHFGPYTPGFRIIPYDDTDALAAQCADPSVVAFLVEPIQGEAGVIIPSEGYLKKVRQLCSEHDVLWMADEIQTGLGRTGRMLAVAHEAVRPDVLILGKALSGGILPVSAVLADDAVMEVLTPGTHGSTFGGNPVGARVLREAVGVVIDENLAGNAERMGNLFRRTLQQIDHPAIREVRGRGLLNAVEFSEDAGFTGRQFCEALLAEGILAKDTHGQTVRFAPPLIIREAEMAEALDRILRVFRRLLA